MWQADRKNPHRRTPAGLLSVYIGERDVAWAVATRRRGASSTETLPVRVPISALFPASPAARLQALAAVLAGIERGVARRLRFIVADSWLATAIVPWRAGAAHVAQEQAHARDCLLALGHEVPGEDTIRVDSAPFRSARLCIAYPAVLLALLRDCAQRLRLPLVSVQPLSQVARGLAGSATAAQPLMVVDDGMILVGAATGGAGPRATDLLACTRTGDTAVDYRQWLACWRRACLRHPAMQSQPGPVLLDLRVAANADDTGLPSGWRRAESASGALGLAALLAIAPGPGGPLDALTPVAHWRASVCLAAALLVGAAFLAGDAWRTHARADVLVAGQREAGASVQATASQAPRWPRAELPRVQARDAAIRLLNAPANAPLRALTPPADLAITPQTVTITPLDAGEAGFAVSLSARAQQITDMTRYIAYLQEQPALSSTLLLRHEHEAAGTLHFSIESRWRELP